MIEINSEINSLTESELSNLIRKLEADIEYQQALLKACEDRYLQLKEDRRESDRIIRDRKAYEQHLQNQANAERIERKISEYLEKNWIRFHFLFVKTMKPYDASLIHTKCVRPHASLPRQIMIYFINELSGLNETEVSLYFEMTNSAAAVNYSKKTVEALKMYPQFRVIFEEIREQMRFMRVKKGGKKNELNQRRKTA